MPVEAAWLGWGHERPCKTWKKTTIKWKPVITSIWSSSCWQNCPLGPPSRVQALAENREHRSCRKIKFMWVHFMQQGSQEFASSPQPIPVFLHLLAHFSIAPLFFYVETRISSKSAQVVILPMSLNLSPYEALQACIIITRHLSTSPATCTLSFSWLLYICYTSVTKTSFKILKESWYIDFLLPWFWVSGNFPSL